jgi:predicted dehydrogenase
MEFLMRVGVMGIHYGHIGGMFRSAVDAHNAEIVGIVEPDDGLYQQYSADLDIPRFESLEAMLDGAKPGVVMEGLAHHEKVDMVEKCAAAGVHIILDKPLCRSMEDLNRIQSAVQKHNTRLTMFFTSRSHPPFIALRDAIMRGELGEIVSLISTHPHKLGDWAPPWYFDPEVYAGTFNDVACHGVDQIRWLTGAECVGVHALGAHKKHPKMEMDHVQASFELSNGAGALLTADWLTPEDSPSFGDTRFIIMGTTGSAHLRAYAKDSLLIVADGKGAYEPEFAKKGTKGFVENMVDAFDREEENFISTSDVLGVAKACIVAEESASKGGEFLRIT